MMCEEETDFYPINNIHDKDAAYIEVVKAEEKPLMAKVEVFFSDNSEQKVESGVLDMSQTALFKIGVLLRTNEKLSYEGHVKMMCEDVELCETVAVNGIDDDVTVSSAFDIPLYSYWLRKSSVPFEDGHIYKVMMMGAKNGEDMELKVADAPATYIKREGDLLTLTHDIPTSIESAAASTVSVSREGSQIVVTGEGIKSVSLYNVSGELITTSPSQHLTISTPHHLNISPSLHLVHHSEPVAAPYLRHILFRVASAQQLLSEVYQFRSIGKSGHAAVTIEVGSKSNVVDTHYAYSVLKMLHSVSDASPAISTQETIV
jgi:hypothetical protein